MQSRRLAVAAACCFLIKPSAAFAQGPEPVRLVLQITVDGLRADLIHRYGERFQESGFRALTESGAVYTQAYYQHANTETIVGHTTLATGASPMVHGMIGNAWFDRGQARLGYNVEDAEFPLLPVRELVDAGAQVDPAQQAAGSDGRSPRAILAPTLSDTMQAFYAGESKIFAVSGKDRGAIPLAGRTGKAFWYSTDSGDFVTSAYYYDTYPDWARQWNEGRLANRYIGREWTLSDAPSSYRNQDRDDRPYEADLKGYGRVFPHPYGEPSDGLFYTRLLASPVVDQLTLDFARTLIAAESLGEDAIPDFLAISFSGVDAVNHFFGPSSLEQEALMRELDGTLAALLSHIDSHVGLQHTLIVLSADHGMVDMPEYVAELGFDAGRLYPQVVANVANETGKQLFGIDEIVQSFFRPNLYLDQEKIRAAGLNEAVVAEAIANALTGIDGVAAALASHDLFSTGDSALVDKVRRNYHPARSGDIYVVQSPYWFLYSKGAIAAAHGSPFHYDAHVPMIFKGPTIEAQTVHRIVHPADIVPTLAALLEITPPAMVQGKPLPEVLGSGNR